MESKLTAKGHPLPRLRKMAPRLGSGVSKKRTYENNTENTVRTSKSTGSQTLFGVGLTTPSTMSKTVSPPSRRNIKVRPWARKRGAS